MKHSVAANAAVTVQTSEGYAKLCVGRMHELSAHFAEVAFERLSRMTFFAFLFSHFL
jgi:hypothetical protein